MRLDGGIKASGVPELMGIDLPGVFPVRPEAVRPANDAAHNFGARGRALVLDLVRERGLTVMTVSPSSPTLLPRGEKGAS
jgi:hypothetical protein